ncbi:unnamed protein product [Gadus morhua 'NCC']
MTPLEVSPSHHPRRPKRTVPPVSVRSWVLVPVSVPLPWLRCKYPPFPRRRPVSYYDGTPLPPLPDCEERGGWEGPRHHIWTFPGSQGSMIQGFMIQPAFISEPPVARSASRGRAYARQPSTHGRAPVGSLYNPYHSLGSPRWSVV